ncbi:unnamed protein product [Spirodela intermedia]|uniref:Pectate lyase n=1 Tax=Spirodela intermedia TaxID=51605 RepID=A0A7I8IR21_SPIIN|nr:unnamed protein product [Spirodela intermedia]CAA6659612.1 unnamed protein product [Spirodela intermedia]
MRHQGKVPFFVSNKASPFGLRRSINASVARRRRLAELSCNTGNPIDDCWRCDPNWEQNRQQLRRLRHRLRQERHGRQEREDLRRHRPQRRRRGHPKTRHPPYAVIQKEPLWIIFAHDMTIKLKEELIMNSYKTIDGRGSTVHIAGGPCITVQYVTNVIIHGLNIHDCKQGGTPTTLSDGDGVSIFGGSHIWVDHNTLYNCQDGLVDAIHGSTAITISNNHFSRHDKVMLLGHSDSYSADKNMQVTIAFNHFGEGLVQRMPRCRLGYFHVVNNDYTHWEMYAVGGSGNPTINSQGNRFLAPNNASARRSWNWRSEGDLFLNGAYFTPSGVGASSTYARASSLGARSSSLIGMITARAGALDCSKGSRC